MGIREERRRELEGLCRKFRIDVINTLHGIQSGHPGGSLSVCEILTALFFEKAKVDPKNPLWPERDRVVLSKGHAAPMLYRVMAERGFFPIDEMKTFRRINSRLQGHPNQKYLPGVEITSGPLGIALPAAVGMAIGLRLDGGKSRVYAVLGDGECNEGVVWEACMSANKFKIDNLTIIIDRNGVQLDGTTGEIMPALDFSKKFAAFGLNPIACDGHDIAALCDAFDRAAAFKGGASVVIAETIKGKGVSFMEGRSSWHGKPIGDDELKLALAELGG